MSGRERIVRGHLAACERAAAGDLPEVTQDDLDRMLRETSQYLAWCDRARGCVVDPDAAAEWDRLLTDLGGEAGA